MSAQSNELFGRIPPNKPDILYYIMGDDKKTLFEVILLCQSSVRFCVEDSTLYG